LTNDDIKYLENTADKLKLNTIRELGKEMK